MDRRDRIAHEACIDVYVDTVKALHASHDYLPSDFREDLAAEWTTVQHAAESIKTTLMQDDPMRDHALSERGMAGGQLHIKSKRLVDSHRRWSQSGRRKNGLLRRLLRWLNLYLGSLASVIGGAELLKEFKEAAEIGLDEADGMYSE